MVNMTCPVAWEAPEDPKPFFQSGQIDFKAHDVGWIVCGIMALIATIASIWLIWKHLTYYTLPSQQRHIVRLLIMVPIYAIVSWMSYLFYHEALYYQTIRDCYEAVLVTSFFYLLVAYTGDTRAEQHAVFRNLDVGKWVWPLGRWKYRPEGMHFLWLMKISVLQYAIVRPVCTLAAVGLEYFDLYCLASWMPWFGHVWCTLLISISVTVAMYCLIAFYYPIRHLVDPYQPILKFLAIKTIVFITFWQDTFLTFLVSFGVIKNTEYFSAEAIQVGINALLQCFWMLLFGFIHIKAFSYLPYRPADRSRMTLRGKAMLNVLDFRDWFWEMKDSTNYMRARRKGRNFTLAEDIRADRYAHLERALGRDRKADLEREMELERSEQKSYWKHPLDEMHDAAGGNGMREAAASGTKGSSDAGGKDGRRRPRGLSDLEKLAAAVDEEDEADCLLSSAPRYRRSESGTNASLDYVSRMYNIGSDSHEDLYPELTQHHCAPSSSAVGGGAPPSIDFDHVATDSGRGTIRRHMDLSAVEEGDEPIEAAGRGSGGGGAGVGAGVGASGIAGWLGWNNYGRPVDQEMLQPHPPQVQARHSHGHGHGHDASGEKSIYLSADDGGPPPSAAAPQLPAEVSWWRSLRNRLSGSHSRGHSHNDQGDEDDEEFEPPTAAIAEKGEGGAGMGSAQTPVVTHRLGQVAEGSWGSSRDLQGRYRQAGQPARQQQPAPGADRHDEGQIDSPTTSLSSISPDVESLLSRLISTHPDSMTASERHVAQTALRNGAPAATAAASAVLTVDSSAARPLSVQPKASLMRLTNEKRTNLAPYPASMAASSQQASIVPSETSSALSRRPTATAHVASVPRSSPSQPSASSHSSQQFVSAAGSLVASSTAPAPAPAPSHVPIDDLPPISLPPLTKKALPAASGPKGKQIKIVIPSPLSPARYPYGQEGEANSGKATPAVGATSAAPEMTRSPSLGSAANQSRGSIRFSDPPSAQAKQARRASDNFPPPGGGGGDAAKKIGSAAAPPIVPHKAASRPTSTGAKPERKATVVIGGMSTAQWKAKQASDAAAATAVSASATPAISSPPVVKSFKGPRDLQTPLPAPFQLRSLASPDPFTVAAQNVAPTTASAAARSSWNEKMSITSRPTTTGATLLGGTSFEVGSIVTRDQVVRQSGVRARVDTFSTPGGGGGGGRGYGQISMSMQGQGSYGPRPQRASMHHVPPPSAVPRQHSAPHPHARPGAVAVATGGGYGDVYSDSPPFSTSQAYTTYASPSYQDPRFVSSSNRRVSAPVPGGGERGEDRYTNLPSSSRRDSYGQPRGASVAPPHAPLQQPQRQGQGQYRPSQPPSSGGGGWGQFEYID